MNHYSSIAVRAMLRRYGILSGNKGQGFHCNLCDKDLGSTNHFFWYHRDYVLAARKAIDNRAFNLIEIEA